MVQRLARYGIRGVLILGASRFLVTLVLLGMIATEAIANESAKLLVLGAVVGYWLGHGGDSDSGGPDVRDNATRQREAA